jgi:hypothetical protein
MDRAEAVDAAPVQDAHEIDDRVGTGHRRRDGPLVAQAGGDRRDLPDRAHRLQEQRAVRAPHRHPHDPAVARQALHQIAADEAGPAEDGDGARCHDRPHS